MYVCTLTAQAQPPCITTYQCRDKRRRDAEQSSNRFGSSDPGDEAGRRVDEHPIAPGVMSVMQTKVFRTQMLWLSHCIVSETMR